MHRHPISRRDCVKTILWTTCVSWLAGKSWPSFLATEVSAAPFEPDAIFRLRVADFPALAAAGGSVRFGGSEITTYFDGEIERTQAAGIFPTFFVNRPKAAANFVAHAAECTHEGCILNVLDSGIHVCPCHGSRFSALGKRLSGKAMMDLPTYDVVPEADGVLAVILPRSIDSAILTFTATQTVVGPGSTRLKISFGSYSAMTYEVRFKPLGGKTSSVVPHSPTPTGPLTSPSVMGIDDVLDLYVNPPAENGLFQVAIVVTEV